MKKILALVLALVMVLAATSAFAADLLPAQGAHVREGELTDRIPGRGYVSVPFIQFFLHPGKRLREQLVQADLHSIRID